MKPPSFDIIISIILGFGLATLFRKVCRGKDCVIIKGPKLSSVKDKIFKFVNILMFLNSFLMFFNVF